MFARCCSMIIFRRHPTHSLASLHVGLIWAAYKNVSFFYVASLTQKNLSYFYPLQQAAFDAPWNFTCQVKNISQNNIGPEDSEGFLWWAGRPIPLSHCRNDLYLQKLCSLSETAWQLTCSCCGHRILKACQCVMDDVWKPRSCTSLKVTQGMRRPTGWPDEECCDDAWITHLSTAIHKNRLLYGSKGAS